MKKIIATLLGAYMCSIAFASDVIITREAKKIDAKISEVGIFVVKYRLANETDGPTYVMPKNKIAAISYENGRVETYFDGNTMSSDSGSVDSAKMDSAVAAAYVEPEVSQAAQPVFQPQPVLQEADSMAGYDVQESYCNARRHRPRYFQSRQNDYVNPFSGIRFKVEVAPLFGARENLYGRRYEDDRGYSRHYQDSSSAVKPGLSGAIGVGYQFNEFFYLGAGFDVAALDKFDWVTISEFIDFNVYCIRRKWTPMAGLRLGIATMLEPEDRMGMFVEPAVGVVDRISNKLSLGIAIGYRANFFDSYTNSIENSDRYYYDDKTVSSYFAKVYFMF